MTQKNAYAAWHKPNEWELIEQRIALGHSAPRIARDLKIDPERVHAVWDYLDELVAVEAHAPAVRVRAPTGVTPRRALRRRTPAQTPLKLAACGTYAAGRRHERTGEPVDPECRAALSAKEAARRNRVSGVS